MHAAHDLPVLGDAAGTTGAGARYLTIRNFGPLQNVTVRLENPLVIVAEDGVPVTLLLRAIRCLVDPSARPRPEDFRDPARPIEMGLSDGSGARLAGLRATRIAEAVSLHRTHPGMDGPVVFLGAARREGLRFADVSRRLRLNTGQFPAPDQHHSGSLRLLELCEACLACDVSSAWILIESPELFLGPHAQRALASLLRALASCGNQVVYTTHSPNLVDGRHTDGIVRLARDQRGGLAAIQGPHIPLSGVPDLVRRLASFDRERNGMFFARRALVVEGASERLSLPFAFRLLGHEPDAEGVAIVDAGGKGNLPFIARTIRALSIPTVVLHDRDAPADGQESVEDLLLNRAIAMAAGQRNVVQLTPDFEGVSRLRARARHKPSQAWLRYAEMVEAAELPAPIVEAIGRLMGR
ncbi:MAG: TOPRIM nucleotidyl transferase/hydrolase domain-containing protein [Chloroflexota bacterium]